QTDHGERKSAVRNDDEQRKHEARADASPYEATAESKGRAENDEDDDPNHVRRALGHDDRGRLRHRHAVRLGQDEGLENLADLARRYGEDEAREEREEAIELRHATDIEPRQVELPLEIAQEVVPEGEPAGDRERRSLKVRERLPDLSESSVD